MDDLQDFFPERGETSEWAVLDTKETQCIEGLIKYYVVFEEQTEEIAKNKAWADLQREFSRLAQYKWYR